MKAIITKLFPADDRHPARVRASDGDKHSVTIPVDQHDEAHEQAAIALCHKMDWTGTLIKGWVKHGVWVFVFDDAREKLAIPPKGQKK